MCRDDFDAARLPRERHWGPPDRTRARVARSGLHAPLARELEACTHWFVSIEYRVAAPETRAGARARGRSAREERAPTRAGPRRNPRISAPRAPPPPPQVAEGSAAGGL